MEHGRTFPMPGKKLWNSGTYRLIGLAPALSHSNRTTTNCLKKGYPSLDSFPISLLFILTFYFIIYSLYCMYPVSPA